MTRKFRIFTDFDKEEAWLTAMAKRGLLVSSGGPFYGFTKSAPSDTIVRVDYVATMSDAAFSDYVTLFADAGWTHVAGSRKSGAQYFATQSADADTDIFSDAASRAERSKRAMRGFGATLIPLAVVAFIFLRPGGFGESSLWNPSTWYLTDGLWDLPSNIFWPAFLFETPFVVLRIGVPVLMSIAAVYVAVLFFAYSAQYNRYARIAAQQG